MRFFRIAYHACRSDGDKEKVASNKFPMWKTGVECQRYSDKICGESIHSSKQMYGSTKRFMYITIMCYSA